MWSIVKCAVVAGGVTYTLGISATISAACTLAPYAPLAIGASAAYSVVSWVSDAMSCAAQQPPQKNHCACSGEEKSTTDVLVK
jgi:hypothetical protein